MKAFTQRLHFWKEAHLRISRLSGQVQGHNVLVADGLPSTERLVIYTVSQKDDADVAHQPILVIFGRDVAERVCYQMVFVITPLLTNVSALPGET